MLNGVRREIWTIDRNVALTLTGSLKDYLRQFSYAEPRFGLVVLGVFAGVGLVLVALGVYSVIAYTVSRQTHEIGIRMALGARRADVLRLVMRMGLRLIGLGLVAGMLVTLGVSRVLTSQLWAYRPRIRSRCPAWWRLWQLPDSPHATSLPGAPPVWTRWSP
jgi:putative ABC transport system permease protein